MKYVTSSKVVIQAVSFLELASSTFLGTQAPS